MGDILILLLVGSIVYVGLSTRHRDTIREASALEQEFEAEILSAEKKKAEEDERARAMKYASDNIDEAQKRFADAREADAQSRLAGPAAQEDPVNGFSLGDREEVV